MVEIPRLPLVVATLVFTLLLGVIGWSIRGSDDGPNPPQEGDSGLVIAGSESSPGPEEDPAGSTADETLVVETGGVTGAAATSNGPASTPEGSGQSSDQASETGASSMSGRDAASSTTDRTAATTTASEPAATEPTAATATTTAQAATASTAATGGGAPAGSGYFTTLGPGSKLPSGAQCASRVRSVPENVPENGPYNRVRGRSISGTYFSTNTAIAGTDYESRIDGDFVGSTDEIIQWASCKWGFDEDRVRAVVYAESSWFAGKLGDCGERTQARTGGDGGCASVGLIQVRSAEVGGTHHPGMYPAALESSAMNLDYALAIRRLCYEGLESWLSQSNGSYGPGDEWGCIGRWFSGSFNDGSADGYVAKVQEILRERKWETQWVGCPDWRESFYCSGLNRPVS